MNFGNGAAVKLRPNRRPSPATKEPWWLQLMRQHPVKSATTIAFVLGGTMLMMFFGHLQELPDLDLSSSAATLWALAVMGGLVSIFLLALPLLPGFELRMDEPGRAWKRHFAHQLAVSIPPLAALTVVMMGIGLHTSVEPWAFWPLLVSGMAWTAIDTRRPHIIRAASEAGEPAPTTWAIAFQMVSGMFTWTLTLFCGFTFLTALYRPSETDGWPLILVILGQLGLLYVAALAGTTLDWRKERAAIAGLAAATFILPALLSGNVTGIAVGAVRALGLGERPARLVVTANGCDVINKAAGQRVCEVAEGQTTTVVCPVILKSRIGSPYFVELSPLNAEGTWPERKQHPLIPIAKADVLSWPRIDLSNQKTAMAEADEAASAPADRKVSAHVVAPARSMLTFLNESGLAESQRGWLHDACKGATP
jgi:hypothetical protein